MSRILMKKLLRAACYKMPVLSIDAITGVHFVSQIIVKRDFCRDLSEHQKKLMARGLPKREAMPGVEHIIVVASGKGGVGKSTVAVNLAVTLATMGKRVGLMDADISGPSIPLMMNLHEKPLVNQRNYLIPLMSYGVKCISSGLLADEGKAFIWRGPLIMAAMKRFIKSVEWQPLDILIVDTPPGTGDVPLTIQQHTNISGALIVSTPQAAALDVALRGAEMFKLLNVPVIGLVQNMGHTICGNCQTRTELFKNVTADYVQKMNTNVVVEIPLDGNISYCCDIGVPVVIQHPESQYAQSFNQLAKVVCKHLNTVQSLPPTAAELKKCADEKLSKHTEA